jgi:ParB-like chromosome segregation protein Spo0J
MAKKIVWKGPPALKGLLVPIGTLHEDPANTNTHDERSIATLASSYARFGQQKPVVADNGGVIRAGNGQLQAATRLGWTHLAVVPSDLKGIDLAAYAIADNRTPQLSKLDDLAVAKQLQAIQSEPDYPLEAVGYTDKEVANLLDKLAKEAASTVAPTELPDLTSTELHRITITYQLADEDAIRAFVGQDDDGPLSPHVGKQILGRIKELAAD